MDNLFYYLVYSVAALLGFLIGRSLAPKQGRNKLIIKKLNQIIMTQAELTAALDAATAQIGKISTEVQNLITAVQNTGNTTPEVDAAIANLQAAIQGVDDLNVDA